jgi:hypothetical protein
VIARIIARASAAMAFALLTIVLLLAGIGLLFAALYLWVEQFVAPQGAALITGFAVLALAGVLAVVVRALTKPRRDPRSRRTLSAPGIAASVGSQLGGDAQTIIKEHAPQATMAALAVGFAIGVSPRLRRALWRLLQ